VSNVFMRDPLRLHYYQPPTPPPQNIPMPEKMEVRVVEYTKNDRIAKVELQYRMHYFDQYGGLVNTSNWESVDRVKIDMDAEV